MVVDPQKLILSRKLGLSLLNILDELVQGPTFVVKPIIPILQMPQALKDLLAALPHV